MFISTSPLRLLTVSAICEGIITFSGYLYDNPFTAQGYGTCISSLIYPYMQVSGAAGRIENPALISHTLNRNHEAADWTKIKVFSKYEKNMLSGKSHVYTHKKVQKNLKLINRIAA